MNRFIPDQTIEVSLFSFLDAQSALGMSHFSFKVQKLPIFKVLHLKKENFNRLALCYFSCTTSRPKFEKERKKSIKQFFSKLKIFQKIVIIGPIFHGLCLIGY